MGAPIVSRAHQQTHFKQQHNGQNSPVQRQGPVQASTQLRPSSERWLVATVVAATPAASCIPLPGAATTARPPHSQCCPPACQAPMDAMLPTRQHTRLVPYPCCPCLTSRKQQPAGDRTTTSSAAPCCCCHAPVCTHVEEAEGEPAACIKAAQHRGDAGIADIQWGLHKLTTSRLQHRGQHTPSCSEPEQQRSTAWLRVSNATRTRKHLHHLTCQASPGTAMAFRVSGDKNWQAREHTNQA